MLCQTERHFHITIELLVTFLEIKDKSKKLVPALGSWNSYILSVLGCAATVRSMGLESLPSGNPQSNRQDEVCIDDSVK